MSEKLRVPPPANKAIRDGKDADTAALERHSEQKRKRRGRLRGIGRGLNRGGEWRWRRGGGGGVSVVVVHQKHKPTLCCQGARAIEKFRKDEEKEMRLSTEQAEEAEVTGRPTSEISGERERDGGRRSA